MVTVRRVARRSPVLSPSNLACLSTLPTINLTAGCAHNCAYCYTQGYSFYPGRGIVTLYENTLTQLKDELKRTARWPAAVYFSPSSDLFQPVPAVLAMAHSVLELLLGEDIGVSILTKGAIPAETMALLARHAGLVRCQIGVITADQTVASQFEVSAAPVRVRLEQIRQLIDAGIPVEARLDPILPCITDGRDALRALFELLATAGVRKAAAGVLFLRPAIVAAMRRSVPPATLWPLLDAYRAHDRMALRGGTPVRVDALPRSLRAEILGRVRDAAAEHAIAVAICACKNPDLATGTCNIAGTSPPRQRAVRQPMLLDVPAAEAPRPSS